MTEANKQDIKPRVSRTQRRQQQRLKKESKSQSSSGDDGDSKPGQTSHRESTQARQDQEEEDYYLSDELSTGDDPRPGAVRHSLNDSQREDSMDNLNEEPSTRAAIDQETLSEAVHLNGCCEGQVPMCS